MSTYRVEVSPIARKKFNRILDWIEDKFDLLVAGDVDQKLDLVLKQIALLPFSFPQEILKDGQIVRKVQINNLTLLFYTVDEKQQMVDVVNIVDARMDWK